MSPHPPSPPGAHHHRPRDPNEEALLLVILRFAENVCQLYPSALALTLAADPNAVKARASVLPPRASGSTDAGECVLN